MFFGIEKCAFSVNSQANKLHFSVGKAYIQA